MSDQERIASLERALIALLGLLAFVDAEPWVIQRIEDLTTEFRAGQSGEASNG